MPDAILAFSLRSEGADTLNYYEVCCFRLKQGWQGNRSGLGRDFTGNRPDGATFDGRSTGAEKLYSRI